MMTEKELIAEMLQNLEMQDFMSSYLEEAEWLMKQGLRREVECVSEVIDKVLRLISFDTSFCIPQMIKESKDSLKRQIKQMVEKDYRIDLGYSEQSEVKKEEEE